MLGYARLLKQKNDKIHELEQTLRRQDDEIWELKEMCQSALKALDAIYDSRDSEASRSGRTTSSGHKAEDNAGCQCSEGEQPGGSACLDHDGKSVPFRMRFQRLRSDKEQTSSACTTWSLDEYEKRKKEQTGSACHRERTAQERLDWLHWRLRTGAKYLGADHALTLDLLADLIEQSKEPYQREHFWPADGKEGPCEDKSETVESGSESSNKGGTPHAEEYCDFHGKRDCGHPDCRRL